tara:strand:- start:522 stop:761 length:240 start_codon:yes stop_codon:yes gene_type:complete
VTGILLPIPFSPNNEDTKPLLDKEEVKHGAQNNELFPPPLKTLLKAVVMVFVVLAAFAHFDTIVIIPRRLHILSFVSLL